MSTPCIDCNADALERSAGLEIPLAPPRRPAPHPGPRCATHHRAAVKARKARAHERSVVKTYGLAPGDYAAILEAQGGVCAGCGPRTGRRGVARRLAVDHDHTTGEVRGLLCWTCNRQIGDQRDDPDTFIRLAAYLMNPPARAVLARRHGDDDEQLAMEHRAGPGAVQRPDPAAEAEAAGAGGAELPAGLRTGEDREGRRDRSPGDAGGGADAHLTVLADAHLRVGHIRAGVLYLGDRPASWHMDRLRERQS